MLCTKQLFSHWSEITSSKRSQLACFISHPSAIAWFTYAQRNWSLGGNVHCFGIKAPNSTDLKAPLFYENNMTSHYRRTNNGIDSLHTSTHTEMIASHITLYFFFYVELFLLCRVWPDLGMCEEGSQFSESGKQNLGMTFSWSSASLERREDFSNCNTGTPVNSGSPVNWARGTHQKLNHNLITYIG